MEQHYLDLIKRSITGELDFSCPRFTWDAAGCIQMVKHGVASGSLRTLVGPARLSHLNTLIQSIIKQGIPGDLVEAGCWKGGASLYMKACLQAYAQQDSMQRHLWCADVFTDNQQLFSPFKMAMLTPLVKLLGYMGPQLPERGQNWILNKINHGFASDEYSAETRLRYFKVMQCSKLSTPYRLRYVYEQKGLQEVIDSFKRYGLLDDRVHFLKGWFSEQLPVLAERVDAFSLLRADGDFYHSTQDILSNLYHKLSPGGFCVIDDYGAFPECRRAVDEFRKQHAITDTIHWIDDEAVYWCKDGERIKQAI